jgi:hypothetical protein
MKKLVSTLALICILMVTISGTGAFLMSKVFISKSKVDAVTAVAKGVSLTLSEQIQLFNSLLDKMVQDPEIINAAAQHDAVALANSLAKLENHFPGIVSIKFLLPETAEASTNATTPMSFADHDMAIKTFAKDQLTAIQGDAESDRHMAIARRIMHNGIPVGVVLAGVNYDFIKRIFSATLLEKGYIELRQDKLVLASSGNKRDQSELDDDPINVPNSDWQLYYENSGGTSIVEFSFMVGMVLVPALAVVLCFITGYRKFSGLLAEDMTWVVKAFKDILAEKPLGDYPVNLSETSVALSTLAKYKRAVNNNLFQG